MPNNKLFRGWLSPLIHLANNWVSMLGVAVVTSATVFWLFTLPTAFFGQPKNPYIGILAYLVLPGFFFGGLALIPLGIFLRRRRLVSGELEPASLGPLSWANREVRRLVTLVGLLTFANIVIASQLTYGAVTYMEGVQFCGTTCHTVMQPEYMAYQNSPHSRVECVQCHIGPGASWFVQSKLSGVGQVFAVMLNNYPRPIPVPVHNLRPAQDTCETCHWPQKYAADRLKIFPRYAEDETNTSTKTVLMLKLGGGNKGIGIHGTHLGAGVKIRYAAADEQRQKIPWIQYNGPGRQTVYTSGGTPVDTNKLAVRDMDCLDCHNRPAHAFELPDRALDSAMFGGLIATDLPQMKKKGLELLKAVYPSREDAAVKIPKSLDDFYKQNYAGVYAQRQKDIAAAGREVLSIWERNIFPEMKVSWGRYPLNIGHTDSPGCFRCHDDDHASPDGRKVSQDCSACHSLLSVEEGSPKILQDLGLSAGENTVPTPAKK